MPARPKKTQTWGVKTTIDNRNRYKVQTSKDCCIPTQPCQSYHGRQKPSKRGLTLTERLATPNVNGTKMLGLKVQSNLKAFGNMSSRKI